MINNAEKLNFFSCLQVVRSLAEAYAVGLGSLDSFLANNTIFFTSKLLSEVHAETSSNEIILSFCSSKTEIMYSFICIGVFEWFGKRDF